VRVRVKICGVTSLEDAHLVAECGADAAGFNFWPQSPRYCDPELARDIGAQMPASMDRVGVFVNATVAEIEEIARLAGLSAVQLHGQESAQDCSRISFPVIKAIPVTADLDGSKLAAYDVAAFLLDAPTPAHGGSGTVFDWSLAAALDLHRPAIIAGGLTPANVGGAIAALHPYGVDVASGVEASPGVKDPGKVAAFMAAVAGEDR
jgi:phosphoribosylanthranilate isomerase